MARYPGAVWKEVSRFRTLMVAIRVNLHTAVTNTTSLFSYFRVWGRVCSHFYVREDGTVEQYVDTRYQAAADLQGNRDTISIETWDGYRRLWFNSGDVPPWTPAQVIALAKLLAWISVTHDIPLVQLTNSLPGRKGISHHRLGVRYRRWLPYRPGWLVPGGLRYSDTYGKVCPGDARIAQIPQIINLARSIVAGGEIPRDVGGSVSRGRYRGYSMVYVRELQSLLNAVNDAGLLVDGVLGPVTEAAVRVYQARHGLVVDGDPGPVTMRHLRGAASGSRYDAAYVREVQTLLNVVSGAGLVVDGDLGPVTVDAVRRYQARHGLLVDGDPGPITLEHLRARTRPAPVPIPRPAPPSVFPLRVDGLWGPTTTEGLQIRLSVPNHRRFDRVTICAFQDVIGAKVDGKWGRYSKRAMQRWLRVHVDGWIGPKTVKALQRRLNAGEIR